MKKIEIKTTFKKLLADVYTPVGIYLRLRDRFRDTILLESTDFHAGENSYSFIGINAIAGIEISDPSSIEYKLPAQKAENIAIHSSTHVPDLLWEFMQRFEIAEVVPPPVKTVQGLFGYTTYDAVQFFDSIALSKKENKEPVASIDIPLMRYRLYQYVIIINHFKDELFICENLVNAIESEMDVVESLIKSKDVPVFPFVAKGNENSNLSNEEYMWPARCSLLKVLKGFDVAKQRMSEINITLSAKRVRK